MLDFKVLTDSISGKHYLQTSLSGKNLLTTPQLNKGMAFTEQERLDFELMGKLPCRILTLQEQVDRAVEQMKSYNNRLEKNIYLNNLHDKNQTIFYKLASERLEELLPVIYTPTVGDAVISFSRKYRQARGLYFSYPERKHLDQILDNRSNPEVDIVVITDGEGVLGIGDQGIGGMEITIAKLMVYTLCGGVNPCRAMPIMIDVGTDNETLLNDPDYAGWRHKRIRGKAYDEFIDAVVATLRKKLPDAFIHWEDFGTENAINILNRYQDNFCTFNDDIQGTGATALATILAASKALNKNISEQRIIIFGAGSAGCGIADQIYQGLIADGLSKQEARNKIWLIDRFGLITTRLANCRPTQQFYARTADEVDAWNVEDRDNIRLLEVIKHVNPTVLIGCSAQTGAFNEEVITLMADKIEHPVILPLSNPTNRAEATPEDIIIWTKGKALIATGSPFSPVIYNEKTYKIAQCNNARIFPGIGLGVIVSKAKKLTHEMMLAACHALSNASPAIEDLDSPLLPSANDAEKVGKHVALAIATAAIKAGLSDESLLTIEQKISDYYWHPEYLPYCRMK